MWRLREDDEDDVRMTGMMGTTWRQHGGNGGMGWRQRRPQPWRVWRPHGDLLGTIGMTWGQQGQCGDDEYNVGTMWGRWGPHGDNKITKNASTFEQIEIIEFCLKIWDPLALPHTYRLIWCVGGGMSYPKWHFYKKSAPVALEKKIFLFLHWIPLDHI